VRRAEIQDPHLTVIGDEDVLRIDVSVHDAARVSVGESGTHVANEGQRVRPRQGKRASSVQHMIQKRADQRFHGKEGVVVVAVEFMHADDVRMRQQLQMLELALQLGEQVLSLGNRGMQHFDGYPLPRVGQIKAIFVDCIEHGAHAAVTQHSPYSVSAAQYIADREFADFPGFGPRSRRLVG
jgi:hypothetical protein